MKRSSVTILTFLIGFAGLGVGAAAAEIEPGVTQSGKYWLWYENPQIKVEVVYRWAKKNLGEEWLILRVSLAGEGGRYTRVDRNGVSVRTPKGQTIPLVGADEFRSVYNSLRAKYDRADVWAGPSERFLAGGRIHDQWFLMPPGTGRAVEIINVQPRLVASGPMVFRVPGGVQAGQWMLIIELEEGDARIPIVLVD